MRFVAVVAGDGYTCARTREGTAYCWGFNRWGQLGDGELDPSRAGAPLFGAAAFDTAGSLRDTLPQTVRGELPFRLLTAGSRHTCGLTTEGRAYCWGFGRFGELGTGERASAAAPQPVASDLRFRTLSAGGTHTCGVTESGDAYCWGGNWHGQLGIGSEAALATEPSPVAGDHHWRSLDAGGIHTCGLTASRRAYCWGDRRDGRLGTGREEPGDVFEPAPVAGGRRYRALEASGVRSCAITEGEALLCWGRGLHEPAPVPMARSGLRLDSVSVLSVADARVCVVEAAGTLVCVPAGEDGESLVDPGPGSDPGGTRRIVDVAVGASLYGSHVCVLFEEGVLECRGDDRHGQLGIYGAKRRAGSR